MFWYRISQDLCNFFRSIMELILLVQWHQTYSVLSNPLAAMKTLERNWAKVAEITLIVLYTIFMIFDICTVLIDHVNSGMGDKTEKIDDMYTILEIIQVVLQLILLICYGTLFVLFIALIKRDEKRFASLYKQVIGFFSIILIILISNLVLVIIFYQV